MSMVNREVAPCRRVGASPADTHGVRGSRQAPGTVPESVISGPTRVAEAVRQSLIPHRLPLRCLLAVSMLGLPVITQAMPPSINLSTLNGSNGFVVNGIDAGDFSGRSVSSAGDVNGDGVDDLIIGAFGADPNGHSQAGESYVVFGGSTVGSSGSINLSTLTGSNGFFVNGIDVDDRSGISVSGAGDVNGDGVDDLIIGAQDADPGGNDAAGESYVVFGGGALGSFGSINLSALNGSNGFVVNGIDVDDRSGISVSSAGDINGDGVDDLIIGANRADPNSHSDAGESYVVFGGSGVGSSGSINLSTLNGINGFVVNGIDAYDVSGYSVSGAGDVNGDGIGDLIIGAPRADPNSNSAAGESYVVFGGSTVGSGGSLSLAALNGSAGIVVNGVDASDQSGYSISGAGDINSDGVDDLIIGAFFADPTGHINAGESYVVFGGSTLGSFGSINLSGINGINGFVLSGIDSYDYSGGSVSGAGDVNGDGVDDLIIGADYASPNGISTAGESYVVFGGSSVGSSGAINLSALNGNNGFVLNGIDADDHSGRSVSGAGDVNGDGVDDVIIGASSADPNVHSDAGESYVVFGVPSPLIAPTVEADLVSSCLAGNGRVDLNIVNTQTATSVYRLELQGQSPRQRTVLFEDWGRIPITGRPPGTYAAVVKRDGVTILSENIVINCAAAVPPVSAPEVTIVDACRAGNGQVFFQMVNPTSSSRAYVVEFEGVANRSTTAAPFGQALRGTTGRPDGVYNYRVRTGSTVVDSGAVEVNCD